MRAIRKSLKNSILKELILAGDRQDWKYFEALQFAYMRLVNTTEGPTHDKNETTET